MEERREREVLVDDSLLSLCRCPVANLTETLVGGQRGRRATLTRVSGILMPYCVMHGKMLAKKTKTTKNGAGCDAVAGEMERTWRTGVGRMGNEGKVWCGWLRQQEEPVCVCI